jgi:IS605 OrfB family transposase
MRRTSHIYLNNYANKGKIEKLREFLLSYANIVNYYIEMFWSDNNKNKFTNQLSDKEITDRGVKRFDITARLSQMACKQAKEIVNSQHKKSKCQQRMPLFRNITANIDSRFFTMEKFNGAFDRALKFQSGIPKLIIPFNDTKHNKGLVKNGWQLGNSIQLGLDKKRRVFINLVYEKQRPLLKNDGKLLCLDNGYQSLFATNEGKLIGTELKDKIKQAGKRRKSLHHFVNTEINREIKNIPLDETKILVLENLKNVKKGKRGKFSRQSNRLLSFWHYARAIEQLRQHCEERGILLKFKSPAFTSQRCPVCSKIDRRNRNGEKFACIKCGYSNNADIVSAKNLEHCELAGVYSLHSLPSQFN